MEVDARPPSHLERLPYTASTANASAANAQAAHAWAADAQAERSAMPPSAYGGAQPTHPAQFAPPAATPPPELRPSYLEGPPLP